MADKKIITGANEEDIWEQISNDLNHEEILDYYAVIEHGGQEIELYMEVDLGGGFEGGYAETSLTSILTAANGFRFAIHREHFVDEIGKFFGMQDVTIGYPEFDKKFVVKTNDEQKVKALFSNDTARQAFQMLEEDFTFGITVHNHKEVLEYATDNALTDVEKLRSVFKAFYTVLTTLNSSAY